MKISILRLARNDLREIREYLSGFGESPPGKFRESFEKICVQVSDMPYMFGEYEYNPLYRKAVVVYDYLIFYQVDEIKGIIKIYRISHGKRNIMPLLK